MRHPNPIPGRCVAALLAAVVTPTIGALADVSIDRPTPAPLRFGEGHFPITRSPAAFPAVVAADFNDDGHTDLAWLCDPNPGREPDWGDRVTVALGYGDGRFGEHSVLDLPGGELIADDFNADGLPDLAVAGDTIQIRFNLGDAEFDEIVDTQIDAANFSELGLAITPADVDHDGDTDLIITDAEGRLDSAINTGGVFSLVLGNRSFLAADRPRTLDFDNDQIPDLIYLQNPGSVLVRRGLGNGTFSAIPIAELTGYSAVSAWTPPGGGVPLVSLTESGTGNVRVFAANAATGLDADPLLELDTGVTDGLARLLDLDVDGRPDLVCGPRVFFSALFTNGNGRSITTPLPLTVNERAGNFESNNSAGFLLVDVNKDGAPDRVEPGYVRLNLRDEDLLPAMGHRSIGPSLDVHSHLAADDLDGDGLTDVVAAGFEVLELRYGLPAGATRTQRPLGDPVSLPHGLEEFSGFLTLLIDLNADTLPDIVALDRRPRVVVFLNLGNRQFAAPQTLTLTAGDSDIVGMSAGDLDADGDPDLVVSNDADNQLIVLLNKGGVLSEGQRLALPTGDYTTVTLLDYNGDNRPDAILGDASDDRVLFARGNADATFTPIGYLYVPTAPYWLTATDADSDGIDDLLVTTRDPDDGPSPILIWTRTAQHTLNFIPVEIPTSYPALEAFCADIDGDGNNDLVTAQTVRDVGAIIVYDGSPEQQGWPELDRFSVELARLDEPFPAAIIAPDLNNDDRPDLLWTGAEPRFDVAIQDPIAMGPCRSDMQGDTIVDSGDITAFVELFLEQHDAADLNHDTVVDLADIQLFVDRFLNGC